MGRTELWDDFWGLKSIGDLEAIQGFINHANKVAMDDFNELKSNLVEVKAMRQALESSAEAMKVKIKPVCDEYVAEIKQQFEGSPGNVPLVNGCLAAQGASRSMVSLGQVIKGCGDQCNPGDGDLATAPGHCDNGNCHHQLRCVQLVENFLSGGASGSKWAAADYEMQQLCNAPRNRMVVTAPAGWRLPVGVPMSASATAAPMVSAVPLDALFFMAFQRDSEMFPSAPGRPTPRDHSALISCRAAQQGSIRCHSSVRDRGKMSRFF